MRILILYWHEGPDDLRLGVRQHLHSLDGSKNKHQIVYWNAFYGVPSWLESLPDIDAVVLHALLLCMRASEPPGVLGDLKEKLRWVRSLDCAKIAIPQDEYDHSELLDEWLWELDVTAIFSIFGEEYRSLFYPMMSEKATFYRCLTGYIDAGAARDYASMLPPVNERPYDIVYRATRLPYWFGRHGELKHRISYVVAERARARGLRCDISTRAEDTLIGKKWLEFLGSGRTVIGCESGSSVLDRRGRIRAQIEDIRKAHPRSSFEEVSNMMPKGWDDHEFFAISPRHFEAVITKTCQVLVEGSYSGVFEPDRHYIPLKRDLSNVDEVLDQIQDCELVRGIVERAYKDIYLSGRYTYQRFAGDIEAAAEQLIAHRRRPARNSRQVHSRIAWALGSAGARVLNAGILVRAARATVKAAVSWRWARHQVVCLEKGYLALRLILGEPTVRKLLVQYMRHRELRRKVRLDLLLGDLLKLCLLQFASAGKVPTLPSVSVEVRFQDGEGALEFRSRLEATTPENGSGKLADGESLLSIEKDRPLKRILWDHSAIATHILYPISRSKLVPIFLGSNGVHEFQVLTEFARYFPRETWQALFPSRWG